MKMKVGRAWFGNESWRKIGRAAVSDGSENNRQLLASASMAAKSAGQVAPHGVNFEKSRRNARACGGSSSSVNAAQVLYYSFCAAPRVYGANLTSLCCSPPCLLYAGVRGGGVTNVVAALHALNKHMFSSPCLLNSCW